MLSGGERKLGAADVAVLGLAAVLGSGLFAVWGPAAAAAGRWLPFSVVLAGIVAATTAASSAGLTRRSDADQPGTESGVSSALIRLDAGRPDLPAGLARLGGVAFLVGRCCAAAAAAHVFASYVLPSASLPAAVAVVLVATALAVVGVRWTARASYSLVGGIAAVLVVVIVAGLIGPEQDVVTVSAAAPVADPAPAPAGGFLGMVCGAAVVCFAFAGIARVAVLARTARAPEAALRRAAPVAIVATVLTYLLVSVALLAALGPGRLSAEMAPLAAVVDAGRAPALGVLVRVAAAVAAASALVSMIAGVGRTASEMALVGELPEVVATRNARDNPWLAEIAGGVLALVIVVAAGQVATIMLSACCLLIGYAVVNTAALRVARHDRVWPRWTAGLGGALCLLLAALLPTGHVLVALAAIIIGWIGTTVVSRRAPGCRDAGPGPGG